MKKCAACHAKWDDDADVCPSCGVQYKTKATVRESGNSRYKFIQCFYEGCGENAPYMELVNGAPRQLCATHLLRWIDEQRAKGVSMVPKLPDRAPF